MEWDFDKSPEEPEETPKRKPRTHQSRSEEDLTYQIKEARKLLIGNAIVNKKKYLVKEMDVSDNRARVLQFIVAHEDVLQNIYKTYNYAEMTKARNERNSTVRINKNLVMELEELHEAMGFIEDIHSTAIPDFSPQSAPKSKEATAIALLSDVHYEERVEPTVVYGYNEYNPDIANLRLQRYFTGLLKLIRKEREKVPIKTLTVLLLPS